MHRLRKMGLSSLEKGGLRWDLAAAYSCLVGRWRADRVGLLGALGLVWDPSLQETY